MFVLVPPFAALVMAVNRHSGRNYPQHLVFGLHVHAAWFLVAAAGAVVSVLEVGWLTATAQSAVVLYAAVYFVLAMKTAYNTTAAGAVWRAAAVASIDVVAVGGAILAIVLPVLLRRA